MNFLKELHQVEPKTVALSLFSEFNSPFVDTSAPTSACKLPPSLRTFYNSDSKNFSSENLKKLSLEKKGQLVLTPGDLIYVEEATRNQALSEVWYEQRAGWITGSIFKDVAKASILKPPATLISKVCQVKIQYNKAPALMCGKR